MTIFDLRCDRCGTAIIGPATADRDDDRYGVRFAYHPGSRELSDNSSMVCSACWTAMENWLGDETEEVDEPTCSVCGVALESCLFVHRGGSTQWLLCHAHAIEFLNSLRTVEPKLDADSFVLPPPHA
jgi:DNA-directed RNA polymerase subunit RPC12/RpoP